MGTGSVRIFEKRRDMKMTSRRKMLRMMSMMLVDDDSR